MKSLVAPERQIIAARRQAQLVSRAKLRAERRRVPAQPHHPVRLAGMHAGENFVGANDHAPLLVERTDQNFVAGFIEDVRAGDAAAQARVFAAPPRRENGRPRLFHPLQRVQTLAVLEAFCDVPGTPRLDRAKIASAGLVVRRLARNGLKEAWITGGTRVFGWDVIDEDVDPDADQRQLPESVGHPTLDALLPSNAFAMRARAQRLATLFGPEVAVTEQITPMFVAPPAACLASGRTVLFGTVPVTSNDNAESQPEAPRYGEDPTERMQLQAHLVPHLGAGARRAFGGEGLLLHKDWMRLAVDPGAAVSAAPPAASVKALVLLLQQLHVEFDAFGDSAVARALFTRLNDFAIERTQPGGSLRAEPAGEFLRQAKSILLDAEPNYSGLRMPAAWAAVSSSQGTAVFEATLRTLDARFQQLKAAQGRFDDPNAQYVLRAFIRLKPEHAGCPPRLVWSPYSEPFTIAPWYESAGTPPPLIALPDLFDSNILKKLKPNVSFALSPKLAKLLQNDAKDLRDGKGDENGWTIGWICSFSLPIITICAFIVLNIFLQIFAMIFFWLPFLKICIPYPKPK